MSWNANVPATDPAEFDEAVDGCETSPAEGDLPDESKTQLAAAREAAKGFAGDLMNDDKPLEASLNGHACEEGTDGFDSISVSVRQVAAK